MSLRLYSFMRQFTVRVRMMGAIAVVLALLALIAGAGMLGMFRIHQLSGEVIDRSMAVVDRVAQLRLDMSQVRRHEKDMIIQYERPEEIRQIRARWDVETQRIEQSVDDLLARLPNLRREQLQVAHAHLGVYRELFARTAAMLEGGAFTTATSAQRLSVRAGNEFDKADRLLAQIDEAVRMEALASNANRTATLERMLLVFAVLVALALAFVVPLTLLNMQAICRPVERARQLAQAIARGDLARPMEVDGADELADLQRALEQMRAGLASMVAQLRDAGENVATVSRELASGNQDLSSRTEHTAGNVQTTVGSIGDLSGSVEQTADAARAANQLVADASQAAQRGGAVVTQAVRSMHSISQSSQKINDIIDLIDSIAFQTNILALNAAVEAARAGNQGRGFAVVAAEVRSLAQRSAAAAGEIKELIDASVSAVNGGARQVEEAGVVMHEIVASVQRVRDIMVKISLAADRQSHGIGQVNESVQEIDRMTQQNAALVEQSAAAAQSMREQADRLADIVRQFRLEGQAADGSQLRLTN
ncbi:MAG: methyl-accepting chemotaxis protein [Curvibacter sp.]|nr:HAMP domain-containing protein [Curvibacter sp.]